MLDHAWEQVRAGVELIIWSRLAKWDEHHLRFLATEEDAFEVSNSGHREVHGEFGRLICWIVFGVGSEYLTKGICLLNGGTLQDDKPVLRPPFQAENIDDWIRMAINRKQSAAILETTTTFGTLGTTNKELGKILKPSKERDFVLASIDLLRDSMRNRDAHHYARNVRAFHFHVVHDLFIPAFNILLATVDQDELRRTLIET